MEFSQGSSFTFGFKKRARKAPLLICEVEIAFASKEASSQLSLKGRKKKNIPGETVGICESLFRNGQIDGDVGQRVSDFRHARSHFHFQVSTGNSPDASAGPGKPYLMTSVLIDSWGLPLTFRF